LGTLGGSTAVGYSINNSGQVTGSSVTPSGDNHAFLYSNGQMVDISTLGGYFAQGLGINNAGQVTGYSIPSTFRAFLYSNGQIMDLGTLAGADTEARAINDAGQLTGIPARPPVSMPFSTVMGRWWTSARWAVAIVAVR